jgi:hypothetical protein
MTKHSERRLALRDEIFPDEVAYEPPEKGWFKVSRGLPLLLALMSSKKVSGELDPTRVYVELLASHIDGEFIELSSEADHALASGYSGDRAVRTWRERMKALERAGFIRTKSTSTQAYKYVLLVPPEEALDKLRKGNKVPPDWSAAYLSRRLQTGEITAPARANSEAKTSNRKKVRPASLVPSG